MMSASWLQATVGFLGVLLACVRPAEPEPWSLLLVTLDTTRADRIGSYGYGSAVTPALDRLAREGVLFEAAVAPTPLTLPSHASILTGVYPSAHGVHDNGLFALAPEALLLSEVLQRHAWRTGAFVGSYILHARFGLDQGFEVYRAPTPSGSGRGNVERPANEVVDDAIAWLSQLAAGERFFAWVHLYDPHAPYEAPAPWSQRLRDPYDGEIAFCDAQIERLSRFLEERGWAGRLLTVLTADHGESLGQHGEPTHGTFVYQSSVHVPLIFSGAPVSGSRGTRRPELVSTADLPATVLELAGLPQSEMPSVQVSPIPVAKDGTSRIADAVYVESYYPYYAHGWRAIRGLVGNDHKLIDGGRPQLYAWRQDAGEQRDLAGQRAKLLAQMREQLEAFVREHAPLDWIANQEPEFEGSDLLESLGYVVGSRGEDPFAPGLPDARDRAGDLERLDEVRRLVRAWRRLQKQATGGEAPHRDPGRELLESARVLLEQARRDNPRDSTVVRQLAKVELRLGNADAAIPLLEHAVREWPLMLSNRYNLALAYQRAGRGEDAAREMRAIVSREPRYVKAHRWLAEHHVQAGRYGRASWWLAEASRVAEGTDQQREVARRLTWVDARMHARGQSRTPPDPFPSGERAPGPDAARFPGASDPANARRPETASPP